MSPSDTATESYKEFFPQYIKEAVEPKEIAKQFIKIINSDESGKVWVVRKGSKIKAGFHK